MDLLDTILSKMDGPPVVNSKQKQLMKEQKRVMEEARIAEREILNKFRKTIEKRMNEFVQNGSELKLSFEAMNVIERSVVRDIAEVAGLTAYVFGLDEEERYVMVLKKEYTLSDDEHNALRKGEEYDPLKAKEDANQKKAQLIEDQERAKRLRKEGGSLKFLEKYERLVGKETGMEGAVPLEAGKDQQFGFVRSELKRDKRTIEEALADIKAKKQRKLQAEATEDS